MVCTRVSGGDLDVWAEFYKGEISGLLGSLIVLALMTANGRFC